MVKNTGNVALEQFTLTDIMTARKTTGERTGDDTGVGPLAIITGADGLGVCFYVPVHQLDRNGFRPLASSIVKTTGERTVDDTPASIRTLDSGKSSDGVQLDGNVITIPALKRGSSIIAVSTVLLFASNSYPSAPSGTSTLLLGVLSESAIFTVPDAKSFMEGLRISVSSKRLSGIAMRSKLIARLLPHMVPGL